MNDTRRKEKETPRLYAGVAQEAARLCSGSEEEARYTRTASARSRTDTTMEKTTRPRSVENKATRRVQENRTANRREASQLEGSRCKLRRTTFLGRKVSRQAPRVQSLWLKGQEKIRMGKHRPPVPARIKRLVTFMRFMSQETRHTTQQLSDYRIKINYGWI